MSLSHRLAGLTVWFAAMVAFAAGPAPSLPTAEQLYERPTHSHVSLSPDGRHVAMSLRTTERNVIAVYDTVARKASVVARDPDWDLIQPHWVSATRLVYKTWDYRSTISNNRAGAILALDLDGTQPRRLWDSVEQAQTAGQGPWAPMNLLAPGDEASQEILVTLTDRAPPGSLEQFPGSDVYAVNTVTGRRRLLTFDNPGEVETWFVDKRHRVRAAMSVRADKASGKARFQAWLRDSETSPWRLLGEHLMDEPGFLPAGFDQDGSLLILWRGAGEDTIGLYRWDTARQRPGELLMRHPKVDISAEDLMFDSSGQLIGVDVNAMKRERRFFASAEARQQQAIDDAMPGRRNRIARRGDMALVISSSDTDPGSLYLYDTKNSRLEALFRYLPHLADGMLSEKSIISYRARDGQDVPAYLTLPRGKTPRGLPLVVFPHGGPAERDHWGDYWEENEPLVQLLAARGYAVLQPQYRGSLGFGWKHFHSGWKQWDGSSIDDLMDGVEHLAKLGVADPAMVCTMGKSSGGYSAMYLLIKYPHAFRCGISWAGTTDMALFFNEPSAGYANSAWLKYMTPWTHVAPHEASYMASASVARNARRIKVPVLLAYGSADHVVPIVHGQKLRDALLEAGSPVDWTVFPDEGHGWTLAANKLAFARSVERFLASHLSPLLPMSPAAPVQDRRQ